MLEEIRVLPGHCAAIWTIASRRSATEEDMGVGVLPEVFTRVAHATDGAREESAVNHDPVTALVYAAGPMRGH